MVEAKGRRAEVGQGERGERSAQQILDATAGENAHLLPLVADTLNAYGWRWYHVSDSRKDVDRGKRASSKGFLDILAIRPPRLVVAELKDETNDMSDEQRAWFEAWRLVPGVEVYLWRPSDGDRILEILGNVT